MDLPTATPSASRASGRDGRGARHLIGARGVADVPIVLAEARVSEALASVRRAEFAYSGHVVVVDGLSRMVGVAAVERLLREPGDALLASVAGTVPTVTADTPEESAATVAAHRRSPVIGVCGRDGVFLGLVPPETLLEILAAEHEDDMARFGGYLARSAQVRSALEESLVRRLWHRLPWLLLGLLGAMASALLTASFEVQLAQVVAVAFFVPAVVYLADAVGTQTEALVIRGISQGVRLRRVLWTESATGAVIGLVLALLFFPFAVVIGDSVALGTAVGLALFFGAATATAVALTLPYLFARWGKDPAFGSGPLATVVQDLLSISLYLGLVVVIVG
jgi:magnesium transporter